MNNLINKVHRQTNLHTTAGNGPRISIQQKKLFYIALVLLFSQVSMAQLNPNKNYGNNPAAGHYLKMADGTRIYYELFGTGPPVVLLHGGLFGDISEFEQLIPALSKHFQVIAIETRGHCKSEIGHTPFTYSLMASDAYSVIRHITNQRIILIGFSDGAVTALLVAMQHPDLVKKMVYAGANLDNNNDNKPDDLKAIKSMTGESIEKEYPEFVKIRRQVMPEPRRWNDFVSLLKNAWLQPLDINPKKIHSITCPVLIISGDRDEYNSPESLVRAYHSFANAMLAIVPNSDHLIFHNRPDLMESLIMRFISLTNK